jgi:hypothetical protein
MYTLLFFWQNTIKQDSEKTILEFFKILVCVFLKESLLINLPYI